MYSLHIEYNNGSSPFIIFNTTRERYEEELNFQLENNYDDIETIYVHLPSENWKYLNKRNVKVSD